MKSNITFVTCIYDDLYGTEFGGRPHPSRKYYYGIESALKMGSPYVIFCWPKDVEKVELYFKKFLGDAEFDRLVRVLPHDLENTEIRETIRVEKLKRTDIPADRCHDVMFGKFFMLKRAIEDNLFDSDFFFWIDAGLSSSSLFPNKYLDLTDKERRYNSCSLFTPKVPQKLIEKSKEKILLLKLNTKWYSFDKTHLGEGNGSWYIIGGLFGGQKDKILELSNDSIKSFLDHVKDKNTLYTEEQILTIIYSFNKDNFDVVEFDTWYHEDCGDWVKDKIIGKKNFYKMFEEFND
jgi:hypothetical protein